MDELNKYVEAFFRHQRLTPEMEDLKEEVLSNMIAKRDDLISQGMDEETVTKRATESIPAVEPLIGDNQLTDVGKYRLDCMQAMLLNCTLFWILSLPMLFTGFWAFSYLGLLLTLGSGAFYLWKRKQPSEKMSYLSVLASRRRKKAVWMVWGLFFSVSVLVLATAAFGSDIWFGRPVHISGPGEFTSIVARVYLPLLTVFVPITFGNFTDILLKNRKDKENA